MLFILWNADDTGTKSSPSSAMSILDMAFCDQWSDWLPMVVCLLTTASNVDYAGQRQI